MTIPLSFLLSGSSGIGQLSLPRLVPQGVRLGERVLAVSIDPALQYELQAPAAKDVPVPDFLSHWGGALTAPQLALRLANDEPWTVATRPREQITSIKQRLALSLGEGRARLWFGVSTAPLETQSRTAPMFCNTG